jgi:hypothetical protein
MGSYYPDAPAKSVEFTSELDTTQASAIPERFRSILRPQLDRYAETDDEYHARLTELKQCWHGYGQLHSKEREDINACVAAIQRTIELRGFSEPGTGLPPEIETPMLHWPDPCLNLFNLRCTELLAKIVELRAERSQGSHPTSADASGS